MGQGRRPDSRGVAARNAKLKVLRDWVGKDRAIVAVDLASRRQATVVIPPHVMPVLAEHMATSAGVERVFVGRDGRPMRGDAVRQAFDRARRRSGMRTLS